RSSSHERARRADFRDQVPRVRARGSRNHADRCLRLLLRLQGLCNCAASEERRLLRVLFLRLRKMPADPDEFWLLRDTGSVTSNAGASVRLFQAATSHEWDEARRLVREYATSLNVDLSFQNFDAELQHFASEYAAPRGAFILATEAS